MNLQDLFNELGRYLDSKSQQRFGFALIVVDSETQIVSLIHVGLQQEQAVQLCGLVAENEGTLPSTEIPTKERMI